MHPEELILIGVALGLAVATASVRVAQSEWWCRQRAVWMFRWATRPSRRRQARRTTRQALAYAHTRRRRTIPAVGPEPGRHNRGRVCDVGARHPAPEDRRRVAA